jgi:hypothetical protein
MHLNYDRLPQPVSRHSPTSPLEAPPPSSSRHTSAVTEGQQYFTVLRNIVRGTRTGSSPPLHTMYSLRTQRPVGIGWELFAVVSLPSANCERVAQELPHAAQPRGPSSSTTYFLLFLLFPSPGHA